MARDGAGGALVVASFMTIPTARLIDRGYLARVILISDLAGPLMEPAADLMLAAPRGRSGSEFQTPTIPFAIVNGIVLTIAGRHEREIIGRLEKLSELFNDFD